MNRIDQRRSYSSTTGSYSPNSLFTRHRIPVSTVNTGWSQSVTDRLQELVRLDGGWDGYQAEPVSMENAFFVINMLEAICLADTPAPQIVPGPNGDVQIEWHTSLGDLEILVRRPNDVRAWRSGGANDDGEEVELRNDFLLVAQWIKEMMEPAIAFRAAA